MTYAEILAELRKHEATIFRDDNHLKETLAVLTYDTLVALLEKLAEKESP